MRKPPVIDVRKIGIDLRDPEDLKKVRPVAGVDFPPGIERLDVDWFLKKIDIFALAACQDEGALLKLRSDARWTLELIKLKALAEDT